MRFVVPFALLVVAIIHALPTVGAIGPAKLQALYGIPVQEPNLALLLRHRAVLFGLLAAFLAYAAFVPSLHRLALAAGVLSVGSFLLLAWPSGALNAAISKVVWADIVALILLLIAAAVHALSPHRGWA